MGQDQLSSKDMAAIVPREALGPERELTETSLANGMLRLRGLATEGIVLLLMTAGAYLFAHCRELGYCDYYRIPLMFVTVAFQNLVWAGVAAIPLGFVAVQVCGLLLLGTSKFESALTKVYRIAGVVVICLLPTFICYVLFTPELMSQRTFALGAVLYFLVFFGLGPRKHRRESEPVASSSQSGLRSSVRDLMSLIAAVERNWLMWSLFLAVACHAVIWIAVVGFAMGRLEARWETRYLVLVDSGEIVLRRYGDQFVLGKYDTALNRLAGEFKLVGLEDMNRPAISQKLVVGPAVQED